MTENHTIEQCSSEMDQQNNNNKKKDVTEDPETFSCMLQPCPPDSDPNYIGIRRILLFRKAQSGVLRRKDWRCNGRGYVAYRNFINRPDNWLNSQIPSRTSTPGTSGRWISSPSQLSLALEAESWAGSRDIRESQTLSRTVSLGANSSDFEHPRRKAEPAYSFVGMHCIFDECKSMVTVIKFGHMSSDILAYGATDGTITVCTVSEPPSIMKKLTGHSKDVTDFDFSLNNQYIASSSLDKTVRVWDIPNGLCIRVIYGVTSQLCIRFHPVNNNFLTVGNANREVSVFNFSTGRLISKIVVDGEVPALDYDHTGQLIFCGDAQGSIYSVKVNSHQGTLSRTHRTRSISKQKSEFTTIQYRSFSLMTQGPVLLSLTRDGTLSFFSVSLKLQGYLTLRGSLKLAPRLHSIRASFCPLLSLEKGEYIVIGSEDAAVYFYDLTRPKNTCVNKLQGHGYPVIAVAWNHGENLLASSDFGGTVIVWKREKTKQKRLCGDAEEDADHLLTGCYVASVVWNMMSSWVNIPPIFAFNVQDLLELHGTLKTSEAKKEAVRIIILAACWGIWRARNDLIFSGKRCNPTGIFIEAQATAYSWVKDKKKQASWTWENWVGFNVPIT